MVVHVDRDTDCETGPDDEVESTIRTGNGTGIGGRIRIGAHIT